MIPLVNARPGPQALERRYAVDKETALTAVLPLYARHHHHPTPCSAPSPEHPSLCGRRSAEQLMFSPLPLSQS
ncbi:hypothetical protein NDU88_006566 [Pleurodeles waltl]|uniref:Uncharacterized protein n=1 Tax=Pleurodeles waltl TaxID=8319 RepID=A0AAV7UMV9_PLEWA|nr:hypothetical protein NDU88_006566 [Pleurodeles waltl]